MGKKDIAEKDYLNDTLHFADACNGILFEGTQLIQPEDLEEADVELFYPDKGPANTVRLDGIRYWKKKDIHIAVLALEYQSLTDYHMVFRSMLTESMAYYSQWKKNKRRYSKEYGRRFGKKKHLYNSKEYFSVFKSEVRVLFEALKAAGNEIYMNTLFPRIRRIEPETAHLLETLLNIKLDKKHIITDENGKEWMDMCKAWDEHYKSGEKAGIAIGIEQGIKQGLEQGLEQALSRLVYKKVQKSYTPERIAAELEEDISVILPIYEEVRAL